MVSYFRNVIVAIILVSLIGCALNTVRARDVDSKYANSPLKSWFDSLASGKGLCCSFADGYMIDDPDWEVGNPAPDGKTHYRVKLPKPKITSDLEGPSKEFDWYDVPDDAVITEPNKVGKAMVWPIIGYDGVTIRCFLPGSFS